MRRGEEATMAPLVTDAPDLATESPIRNKPLECIQTTAFGASLGLGSSHRQQATPHHGRVPVARLVGLEGAPKDAVIWRYMSFTKFVALLAQRGLFFPRAARLGDRLEGSRPRPNLDQLRAMAEAWSHGDSDNQRRL